MGFKAMIWAWDNERLAASRKMVLLGLASNADDATGLCFPSVPYLSRKTRYNRKTVIEALQELEQMGLVARTDQRAGRTKSIVVWRVNIGATIELDQIEAVPKPGQLEQSQKRDSLSKEAVPETGQLDGEAVPLVDGKLSHLWDTELSREINTPSYSPIEDKPTVAGQPQAGLAAGAGGLLGAEWLQVRERLGHEIGRTEMVRWLGEAKIVGQERDLIVIGVVGKAARSWVDQRYADRIAAIWHRINPAIAVCRVDAIEAA